MQGVTTIGKDLGLIEREQYALHNRKGIEATLLKLRVRSNELAL